MIQPMRTYLRWVVVQRASLSMARSLQDRGRREMRGGRGSLPNDKGSTRRRVSRSVDAWIRRHACDQRVASALAREYPAPQLLWQVGEHVLGQGCVRDPVALV